MVWRFLLESYIKNEENVTKTHFNCFICRLQMEKFEFNKVEIGNINKVFYVCSTQCHQQFVKKEIITKLIKFEKLSNKQKTKMINFYLNIHLNKLVEQQHIEN